jgi:hypothetical protein
VNTAPEIGATYLPIGTANKSAQPVYLDAVPAEGDVPRPRILSVYNGFGGDAGAPPPNTGGGGNNRTSYIDDGAGC